MPSIINIKKVYERRITHEGEIHSASSQRQCHRLIGGHPSILPLASFIRSFSTTAPNQGPFIPFPGSGGFVGQQPRKFQAQQTSGTIVVGKWGLDGEGIIQSSWNLFPWAYKPPASSTEQRFLRQASGAHTMSVQGMYLQYDKNNAYIDEIPMDTRGTREGIITLNDPPDPYRITTLESIVDHGAALTGMA